MNTGMQLLATQRHEIDLAASRHHVTVNRPRTSASTRLGHVLVGAGSRLLADRRSAGRSA